MQDSTLENIRSEAILASSPSLRNIKQEEDQALEEKKAQVVVPPLVQAYEASVESAMAVDKPVKKDVQLTQDDDYLPMVGEVEQRYDLRTQAFDDQAAGITRDQGTYSNEYLKPGKKTVRGRDVANGRRRLDVVEGETPESQQRAAEGIELLRQSTNNIQGGPDETALRGASRVADATIMEGGNYRDFTRYLDQMGIPKDVTRLAWNVANNNKTQSSIGDVLMADAPESEVAELSPEEPPSIPVAELPTNPQWQSAASELYRMEHGNQAFGGTPEDLTDWSLQEMANFGWKILGDRSPFGTDMQNELYGADSSSMSYYALRATQRGPEYAQALLDLINLYEKVDTNLEIVGRSVKALAQDPLSYAGPGAVAKLLTQRLAKSRMSKLLQNVIIAQVAGGVEGAALSAGEDMARQTVAIEAGAQDEYSGARTAGMGAIGLTAGVVLAPAIVLAGPAAKRAARHMRNNYTPAPGHIRAQTGAVGDLAGFTPMAGRSDRVSTRVPTAAKSEEDAMAELLAIDLDAMERGGAIAGNAARIEQPGVYSSLKPHPNPNATLREKMEHYKKQIVDNLLWLHDQMDPAVRARARQWYDGARKQTERWAAKYGLEERQVAAVIASLSPEKDWFQNMSLAERVMDIWSEQQNFQPDTKMMKLGDTIYTPKADKGPRKGKTKLKKDWTRADYKKMAIWNDIKNRTLAELGSDYDRALWLRAFDQAHNPRRHRIWSPEGDMLGYAKTKSGSDSVAAWGYMNPIAKSISVMRDGSRKNISKALGEEHKVRNFYNNIIAPNSEMGEITADTHAVAAGLLEPHGGSAPEVKDVLGGSSSSTITGSSGMYALFADAYRDAAAQRGILPREMQSITWEEGRTLFNNKTDKVKADVQEVWDQYQSGTISISEARSKVYEAAGGTSNPDWTRPGTGPDDAGGTSTYRDDLSGDAIPRRDSRPSTTGTESGDAARSEGSKGRQLAHRRDVYSAGRASRASKPGARAYSRSGGKTLEGLRGVLGVFTPKPATTKGLEAAELPAATIHELDPSEMAGDFFSDLTASKEASPFGAAVHVYTPQEYADMRLFQTPDGKSGFALKPDGDIVSVYSNGGGSVFSMLELATQEGGTKLDAFNTVLPYIYEMAGFKETKRYNWDDKHTPEGWDFDVFKDFNNGRPQVVEMEYKPKHLPPKKPRGHKELSGGN